MLNDVDWLTERVQSLEATQSQLLDTLVTVGHALVSMELRVSPSQPEARELREQLEQIHNAIRMAARSPVALVRAHRRHRTVAVPGRPRPIIPQERRRVSVAGFEHNTTRGAVEAMTDAPKISSRMVMTDMRGRRSVAGDSLLTMDASLQSRVRLTSHLDVLKAPATSFKVEDI
ncbi:hypothetical protein P43SY_011440 [Pythium insidiosum]|uniref:Uncharacterized protein n=1 Tax=Pythium insidiosum TaxID=114742 RepID=A0AAD5LQ41_PYTIN|nr:hypothetical protein P43SY_011440 [Pythium insidiosum]